MKVKKRPQICLALNCRTAEEIKDELAAYGDACQAVEWYPDKNAGLERYSREEFVQLLRLVKSS